MIEPRFVQRAGAAFALVSSLTLAVVVAGALGSWVDGKAGTGPWLMLIFAFAGFGVGIRQLLAAVR